MQNDFIKTIRKEIGKQIDLSNPTKDQRKSLASAGINIEQLQRFALYHKACTTDTLIKYCEYFKIGVVVGK